MKIIIFKNDDNNLTVLHPCYNSYMSDSEKESFLLYVKNKDVPKLSNGNERPCWIVDLEYVKNVDFVRDAWIVDDNGNLIFRTEKAKEIKKNQFRNLRKPLFAELDFHFLKALEEDDNAKILQVKNKKQILRDITAIDMSEYDTPEKLHNFIPDVLKSAV